VTTILFVRCDPSETFGVARAAVVDAGGTVAVWDAVHPDGARPALEGVSGLVVFGSTFNIEHAEEQPFIKEVAEAIREAIDRRIPVLGACFGGQLLAWALDAEVAKGPVREVGFEPIHPTPAAAHDPLFSHLVDGDMAFQWHMDTFAIPDGAEVLATGDRVPNQAFRYRDLAWGAQFHFEVDGPELEAWLDEYGRYGDLGREWGKSAEDVREEKRAHMAGHEERGREIFTRFTLMAAGA
jgi:GMP synthase (glutamine-hydrolysing)